jgi:hypothetical protein
MFRSFPDDGPSGWWLGPDEQAHDHILDNSPNMRSGRVGLAFSWSELSIAPGTKGVLQFKFGLGAARLSNERVRSLSRN